MGVPYISCVQRRENELNALVPTVSNGFINLNLAEIMAREACDTFYRDFDEFGLNQKNRQRVIRAIIWRINLPHATRRVFDLPRIDEERELSATERNAAEHAISGYNVCMRFFTDAEANYLNHRIAIDLLIDYEYWQRLEENL